MRKKPLSGTTSSGTKWKAEPMDPILDGESVLNTRKALEKRKSKTPLTDMGKSGAASKKMPGWEKKSEPDFESPAWYKVRDDLDSSTGNVVGKYAKGQAQEAARKLNVGEQSAKAANRVPAAIKKMDQDMMKAQKKAK